VEFIISDSYMISCMARVHCYARDTASAATVFPCNSQHIDYDNCL